MPFQLIAVTHSLWVEGSSEYSEVGDFAGWVIAIGMRDTDPVAATPAESGISDEDARTHLEGLSGFGSTHFLVSDSDKPAPIWVSKQDVQRQRVERGPLATASED